MRNIGPFDFSESELAGNTSSFFHHNIVLRTLYQGKKHFVYSTRTRTMQSISSQLQPDLPLRMIRNFMPFITTVELAWFLLFLVPIASHPIPISSQPFKLINFLIQLTTFNACHPMPSPSHPMPSSFPFLSPSFYAAPTPIPTILPI